MTAGRQMTSPSRVVLDRRVDNDRTDDEAFTHNLRWEPTEYLTSDDPEQTDDDHVEITEIEAAAFVEWATSSPGTRRG